MIYDDLCTIMEHCFVVIQLTPRHLGSSSSTSASRLMSRALYARGLERQPFSFAFAVTCTLALLESHDVPL